MLTFQTVQDKTANAKHKDISIMNTERDAPLLKTLRRNTLILLKKSSCYKLIRRQKYAAAAQSSPMMKLKS